jgi:hypothetical protein
MGSRLPGRAGGARPGGGTGFGEKLKRPQAAGKPLRSRSGWNGCAPRPHGGHPVPGASDCTRFATRTRRSWRGGYCADDATGASGGPCVLAAGAPEPVSATDGASVATVSSVTVTARRRRGSRNAGTCNASHARTLVAPAIAANAHAPHTHRTVAETARRVACGGCSPPPHSIAERWIGASLRSRFQRSGA